MSWSRGPKRQTYPVPPLYMPTSAHYLQCARARAAPFLKLPTFYSHHHPPSSSAQSINPTSLGSPPMLHNQPLSHLPSLPLSRCIELTEITAAGGRGDRYKKISYVFLEFFSSPHTLSASPYPEMVQVGCTSVLVSSLLPQVSRSYVPSANPTFQPAGRIERYVHVTEIACHKPPCSNMKSLLLPPLHTPHTPSVTILLPPSLTSLSTCKIKHDMRKHSTQGVPGCARNVTEAAAVTHYTHVPRFRPHATPSLTLRGMKLKTLTNTSNLSPLNFFTPAHTLKSRRPT